MSKDSILERLQDIFRDIFEEDDLVINETTDASTIEAWDSLAHINLLAAIQSDFSISFSIDEITDIKNVGDMIDNIQKKMNN